MLIMENILLALNGLRANKTRALLTMLGIIIGIASVIAIMTIGASAKNSVNNGISSMGVNDISISVQKREKAKKEIDDRGLVFKNSRDDVKDPEEQDLITDEMVDRIRTHFKDEINSVSIKQTLSRGLVETKTKNIIVNINYVNQDYFEAKGIVPYAGRVFSEREQKLAKRVCVLPDQVAKKKYPDDPSQCIGKQIDIQGENNNYYTYTIIGVYSKSHSGFNLGDLMSGIEVFIPQSTGQSQTHSGVGYDSITVLAKDTQNVKTLAKQIGDYMNHIYYENNHEFEIKAETMVSLLDQVNKVMDAASIGIAFIAGISLLVGGIGVMNIMLVSVTERTKEIGTRKALGATNESIRLQFITESIVICLIGGILGMLLGIGIGCTAMKIMKYKAVVPVSGVVISVLFSSSIGIFFGYAPANKAATMNPIDALRYE